jgi:hypothetical protein
MDLPPFRGYLYYGGLEKTLYKKAKGMNDEIYEDRQIGFGLDWVRALHLRHGRKPAYPDILFSGPGACGVR